MHGLRDSLNRSFSKHDTLIAEIDGKIVGFADMDNTGYLDRLYVHRNFQGLGIASSLVCELEQHAEDIGVTKFETYASITAMPFFMKRGYKVEEENEVIRNGITLINYKMVKSLNLIKIHCNGEIKNGY